MSKQALLAIVDAASRRVDAIETLAASLAAGMRAGVVDPDHLYTLLSSTAAVVAGDLQRLASAMEGME